MKIQPSLCVSISSKWRRPCEQELEKRAKGFPRGEAIVRKGERSEFSKGLGKYEAHAQDIGLLSVSGLYTLGKDTSCGLLPTPHLALISRWAWRVETRWAKLSQLCQPNGIPGRCSSFTSDPDSLFHLLSIHAMDMLLRSPLKNLIAISVFPLLCVL